MNRSYFGGFRVNPSPTKVTLVITRFHCFCFLLPVFRTLNISSSLIGRTFGNGTSHLPAFSFLFCLIMLLRTLARSSTPLSRRYCVTAFCLVCSSEATLCCFSSCIFISFFSCAFSEYLFLLYIFS